MNSELLAILACPKCRGSITLIQEQNKDIGLECPACAVIYPIRDDIPVLLIEEAIPRQAWQQGNIEK